MIPKFAIIKKTSENIDDLMNEGYRSISLNDDIYDTLLIDLEMKEFAYIPLSHRLLGNIIELNENYKEFPLKDLIKIK